MSVIDEIVNLPLVGLVLPLRIEGMIPSLSVNYTVLIGHGLGSEDPKQKTHLADRWVDLIRKGSMLTGETVSTIAYTARGHGDSHGWEETAESDPHQFTWQRLSSDMVAVGNYYQIPGFVTSGSSMGSGTILHFTHFPSLTFLSFTLFIAYE